MKKKKDEFYFKNLCKSADCSLRAAQYLIEVLRNYDPARTEEYRHAMHELEQKGDSRKHKMTDAVNQAFITPIDREDLLSLSSYIDDITDSIEEILNQIYIGNVQTIRGDILPMVQHSAACIEALQAVLDEFSNFKKSKTIGDLIIRVNDLEEKGDNLFMDGMRKLYQENDVREILVWKGIYECIEDCVDICEHAADVIEMVITKNL